MALNSRHTVSVPVQQFAQDQKIIFKDLIQVMCGIPGQHIDTGTLTIDFKLVGDTVEVVARIIGKSLRK
jgi:hypothetical protein